MERISPNAFRAPAPNDLNHLKDHVFALADDEGINEICHGLRVVSAVASGNYHGIAFDAIRDEERNAA